MNIKVLEKLGLNIKKYRLAQGFTQETLAEKIGIHPTYVGKLEGGKNNPSVKMLFKITRALGITLIDFFDFYK